MRLNWYLRVSSFFFGSTMWLVGSQFLSQIYNRTLAPALHTILGTWCFYSKPHMTFIEQPLCARHHAVIDGELTVDRM